MSREKCTPHKIFSPFLKITCGSGAGRIVLQVDQTASAHQEILWALTQRGENPNLDRHLRLCAAGHRPQAPEARTQPVPDVANFQPLTFRKNATFTGVFANKPFRRTGDALQPTQYVRLMTGQFWSMTYRKWVCF